MTRVRVNLISAYCAAQEDFTGGDEFYITGAIAAGKGDGQETAAVLTKPLSIRADEDKPFGVGGGVVLDADVDPSADLRIALRAYDEDVGRNWDSYKELHDSLADAIAGGLKVAGYPKAAELVPLVKKVSEAAFKADADDHLGDIVADLSIRDLREGFHPRVGVAEGWHLGSHYRYMIKYGILIGDSKPANNIFILSVAHSGNVLDVARAEHRDGAPVIQYRRTGRSNQRFAIEPVSEGTYRIVAQHSAKCLTIENASFFTGTRVVQWGWGGGHHQQWGLEYGGGQLSGASVRIVNEHSGLYLSIKGGSRDTYAGLEIANRAGGVYPGGDDVVFDGQHQIFRLLDSPDPL